MKEIQKGNLREKSKERYKFKGDVLCAKKKPKR